MVLSGVPIKQPETFRGQNDELNIKEDLRVFSRVAFTMHEPSSLQTFKFKIEGLP